MKKFLVFLLSLTICFTPTLVFASGLNGWTLSNPVAQGASTVYTGTKNIIINGADYVKKGTAIVTPTATGVAKVLARGAAGYALSIAVEQLLGALDWVLDAENNRILYTELTPLCGPTAKFCYTMSGGTKAGTPQEVCRKFNKSNGTKYHSASESTCYYNANGQPGSLAPIHKVANVNYDPSAEQEQKSIPLTTVAQKVISNAQGGDAAAQAATTTAAADIVAEAESDQTGVKARPIAQQLENSASTKPADETAAAEAGTATGEATATDPVTGEATSTDLKLEFPVFCSWAPQVCEAAQVVISFPQTLTNWWETSKQKSDSWAKSISDAYTSTKEWFQKEPEKNNEGTQVDVDIPTPFDNSVFSKDRFSVSRQCPVPEQHTISLSGISVNFAFDLKPICSVLELARPALIACSYLYACYIVIGAARNG